MVAQESFFTLVLLKKSDRKLEWLLCGPRERNLCKIRLGKASNRPKKVIINLELLVASHLHDHARQPRKVGLRNTHSSLQMQSLTQPTLAVQHP